MVHHIWTVEGSSRVMLARGSSPSKELLINIEILILLTCINYYISF